MPCRAPRHSRLRQYQRAGVGDKGDPARETAAASRASLYLPPWQERPPQHVFLTRQLPRPPAPWRGQEALMLLLSGPSIRGLCSILTLCFVGWWGGLCLFI